MQKLVGQFPIDPNVGLGTRFPNITDTIGAGYGRTPGAQSIMVLSSQPTIAKPWVIYGWGVQMRGSMGPVTFAPYFGWPGKLLASLMLGGTYTPAIDQPYASPDQRGLQNLVELWDGSQTALPSVSQPGAVLQTSQTLPQPEKLGPADQIALGLWLTPSLLKNCDIFIEGATYTVSYDYQ